MLESKIFYAAGTKLQAASGTSKFRITKETTGYKMILELDIDDKVGSRLKEWDDFKKADPNINDAKIMAMPGMVFIERFDSRKPGSGNLDSASVSLTFDKNNTVTLTACVDLPDGGKTQSAT